MHMIDQDNLYQSTHSYTVGVYYGHRVNAYHKYYDCKLLSNGLGSRESESGEICEKIKMTGD